MAFIKDGEVKVYKTENGFSHKKASKDSERYTVDDLVEESEKDDVSTLKEELNVPN